MSDAETSVLVPTDLLIEVVGRLDALERLAETFEVELPGDPNVSASLRLCVPSYSALWDIEDDAEFERVYEAHPVAIGMDFHSDRVVEAFMKQPNLQLAEELGAYA